MLLYTSDDIWALAQTIFGEARSETDRGMLGVAWVVMNRAQDESDRWPRTIAGVCKQPYQFDCWNRNNPNSYKVLKADLFDLGFRRCYALAAWGLSGAVDDVTNGAIGYVISTINPERANDQLEVTAIIGKFLFYR